MLIRFTTTQTGSPVYINPRYIIAVREEKHFGRPGVGEKNEYSDTLILTTKGDFNVRESLDEVARQVNAIGEEPGERG
jgi:hypothetical protein